MPDDECVLFYKDFAGENSAWKETDRSQESVLHFAAREQKPNSVKWLMENVDPQASFSSTHNLQSYTPLKALQDLLEKGRTRREFGMATVDVSDQFTGFGIESVDCIALLLCRDLQKMSKLERDRLKVGCTCGECLDGFMSPSMSAALLFQAETTYDTLDMEIGDEPRWCEFFSYMFTHLTTDLRQNFRTNKSYRQGFQNIFGFIADCLRHNVVPTRANILKEWEDSSEWPSVTRNYLQRGGTLEGKIEPALIIAFENAEA